MGDQKDFLHLIHLLCADGVRVLQDTIRNVSPFDVLQSSCHTWQDCQMICMRVKADVEKHFFHLNITKYGVLIQ